MENDPTGNDVLQLLKKLKDSNGTYPQELLAVRRQGYLKQVAEVAGGAGLAMGLRNTVKNARGVSGLPPAAGTLLEGILVVALVVEASTLAYFNRDKIVAYFQKLTNQPKVEEVANPPVVYSPIPDIQITPSPNSLVVTGTVTETETPVWTPTLQLAAQPTNPSTGQGTDPGGGEGVSSSSTSVPSDGNTGNEDNGNHYGQTPIPERTKEPGGNSNNNNDGSNQDTQTNPGRGNK